jgi:hypothetical protein
MIIKMNWINVESEPLIDVKNGIITGEKEFIAAVSYKKSGSNKIYWWIKHCVIMEDGLNVVCNDDIEPASWDIEEVEYYCIIESPIKNK